MLQLDNFIAQGHQKIIDHYRWLRDTAKTEVDRERFQRMVEEYEVLKGDTEQQQRGAQHAA